MTVEFLAEECLWRLSVDPGVCGCGKAAPFVFAAVEEDATHGSPVYCSARCWAADQPVADLSGPLRTGSTGWVPPWETQELRYVRLCPPGPGMHVVEITARKSLILYRDEAEVFCGIVVQTLGPDGPGDHSVWVAPTHQRRGIARRLLREAVRRWGHNPAAQRYTQEGAAMAAKANRSNHLKQGLDQAETFYGERP